MSKASFISLLFTLNAFCAEVKVKHESNQQNAVAAQATTYAEKYLLPNMPRELINIIVDYAHYDVQDTFTTDEKIIGLAHDSKTLVLCSEIGEIVFLEKHTLKKITQAFIAKEIMPSRFIQLNDGYAVGTSDGQILIYNEGFVLKQTLEGHSNFISGIAQMPDRNLITTSGDRNIMLWKIDNDMGAYKCVSKAKKHENAIQTLLKVNDGLLVTGGQDGRIVIWNYVDGKLVYNQTIARHMIENKPTHILSLVKITDSIIAAGLSDNSVRIYHLEDGKDRSRYKEFITEDWATALCYLNDGTIVAGSTDGLITFWKVNKENIFEKINEIKVSDGWVKSIEQLDDTTIAVLTENKLIVLSKLLLTIK